MLSDWLDMLQLLISAHLLPLLTFCHPLDFFDTCPPSGAAAHRGEHTSESFPSTISHPIPLFPGAAAHRGGSRWPACGHGQRLHLHHPRGALLLGCSAVAGHKTAAASLPGCTCWPMISQPPPLLVQLLPLTCLLLPRPMPCCRCAPWAAARPPLCTTPRGWPTRWGCPSLRVRGGVEACLRCSHSAAGWDGI